MISFIETNKLNDNNYLIEQGRQFFEFLIESTPQAFFNTLLSMLDEYKDRKGFTLTMPSVETKFDEFYSLYPRKVGRQSALKAFTKIKPSPVVYGKMLEGLAKYKIYWKRQGTKLEFIPHPSSWLNQRRWEDELSVSLENIESRRSSVNAMERILG